MIRRSSRSTSRSPHDLYGAHPREDGLFQIGNTSLTFAVRKVDGVRKSRFFLPDVRDLFSSRLRFRFLTRTTVFPNDIEAGIGFFRVMGSRIVHFFPPYINIVSVRVRALTMCSGQYEFYRTRASHPSSSRIRFFFFFIGWNSECTRERPCRAGGGLTFRVRMRIFSAAANRITRYSFLKNYKTRLFFKNQPITMKKN